MQCSRIIIVVVTWKKWNNFFPEKGEKNGKTECTFVPENWTLYFILYIGIQDRKPLKYEPHCTHVSAFLSSLGIFVGNCLVLGDFQHFMIAICGKIVRHLSPWCSKNVILNSFAAKVLQQILNIEYYDTGKQNITRLKKKNDFKIGYKSLPN